MANKTQERTELSALGESGLIEHLTRNIKIKNPSTIKGVGDDAAVIFNGDKYFVVTTDLLVENIHFNLIYVPLKHLGYKAAVVNFSDVYAMNAIPKQMTVNIAVSNRFSVEALEEFYAGILLACEKYQVDLVGGDTSSSATGFLISITAIGEANKDDIVYRNTARKNDLICVSGDLGAAYLGLLILEREKRIFLENPNIQPELKGYEYVLGRQLKPEARADIIHILQELKIKPTSMIDISDGLASEIIHICKNSSLGCRLYEEKIPIALESVNVAEKLNLSPFTCALNGGEDYELLFTIAQNDYEKIKDNPALSVIGYITEKDEGMNLIARNGTFHRLTAQGWDAFLKK